MGWQCVPQVLGLVYGDGMRKDEKGQAKHRANVKAIVHEAFEIADPIDGHPIPIRKSASDTYDKTRTVNNKYTGAQTADAVLRLLDEEADKTKVEVRTVDKKTGETVIHKRSLPSTTVLAAAVIFNPPSEVAKDWTPEQYDKFFNDCEEVLAQIPFGKRNKKGEIVGPEYYIFRKENIVASAEHWDEGEDVDPPIYTGHKHDMYMPQAEDGKYYGKFIDTYNLTYLNKTFARMMREREWDIDDPDCTDWEKFDSDPAYRAKRKAKIREGGKSVNNYRADKKLKEANAQLEEAGAMVEQAAAIMEDEAHKEQEADALVRDAAADAGEAVAKAQADAEADAAAALDTAMLEAEIEATALLAGAQAEADTLRKTARDAAAKTEMEKKQAETARDHAQWEATAAVAAKLAAEEDRDAARKEAEAARERQMLAQLAIAPLADVKAGMQDEIQSLGRTLASTRKAVEAAKTEADAARKDRDAVKEEIETVKTELATAKTQVQAEIQTYRQGLMDQAKEDAKAAAKAEQACIEAAARAAWDAWLAEKKRKSSEKYDQLIQDANDVLTGASEEHAFLIRWLSHEPFIIKDGPQAGKTWLEVGRMTLQQEIRERRLAEHSQAIKDAAAQSQQNLGDGKGLGE